MSDAITLAIIAGGPGVRMGVPKAWLSVNDQPMLEYLLDRLDWDDPTMLVTSPARKNPPGHERFDLQVMDRVVNQGPLRGLATALENSTTELLAAITVDMPLVTKEQLLWVAEQLRARHGALGIMLKRADGERPRLEPFPCVFHKRAAEFLQQRLNSDDRSVKGLQASPGIHVIAAPPDWPADVWTNLNHPLDLDEFAKAHPSTRVMRS